MVNFYYCVFRFAIYTKHHTLSFSYLIGYIFTYVLVKMLTLV